MNYDDMPPLAVLRDRADGSVWVRVAPNNINTWPFIRIGDEGYAQYRLEGPVDADELSPLSAEDAYTVEAVDRGDAEIASGVTGVPLETVLARYPEVK